MGGAGMINYLALPVAIPLLGAALSIVAIGSRLAQRIVSVVALTATAAVSIDILADVEAGGTIIASLGGWPADIGISFVADLLSSLLLVVATLVLLIVLVFAVGQGAVNERSAFYHPAYLALAAGVANAFLAGDLFNLFVAFELMLMASYVLVTLDGNDKQIRSGTTYVVLNIVESLILLLAIGLVYAATGTVNMAEVGVRAAELDDGVRFGLNALLLIAFGLKAAVFPLFFWLPDSYPAAPSPVTAVFAGLLTKIGVYAILRTETQLFPGQTRTLLIVVGILTMIIGVLGAIAQSDMKRILSFHIVSQIGYMVVGVGIGTEAAIAAAIFFVIHQIPVKTSLFLVEGIVEDVTGTSRLDDVGGMARRSGWTAALFLVPALSLAGIPPLSGFIGKLGLVSAGFDDELYLVAGIALGGSLLTLISMVKIWTGIFWGEVMPAPPRDERGILRDRPFETGAIAACVGLGLAIAIWAGPLYELCLRAAETVAGAVEVTP
jgi:multicomponent Na+:H+ antiporter subunit D